MGGGWWVVGAWTVATRTGIALHLPISSPNFAPGGISARPGVGANFLSLFCAGRHLRSPRSWRSKTPSPYFRREASPLIPELANRTPSRKRCALQKWSAPKRGRPPTRRRRRDRIQYATSPSRQHHHHRNARNAEGYESKANSTKSTPTVWGRVVPTLTKLARTGGPAPMVGGW